MLGALNFLDFLTASNHAFVELSHNLSMSKANFIEKRTVEQVRQYNFYNTAHQKIVWQKQDPQPFSLHSISAFQLRSLNTEKPK